MGINTALYSQSLLQAMGSLPEEIKRKFSLMEEKTEVSSVVAGPTAIAPSNCDTRMPSMESSFRWICRRIGGRADMANLYC